MSAHALSNTNTTLLNVRSSWIWPGPFPQGCRCPQGGWWGIYPPYCPVHNPGVYRVYPYVYPYPVQPYTITVGGGPDDTPYTPPLGTSPIDDVPLVPALRPEEV